MDVEVEFNDFVYLFTLEMLPPHLGVARGDHVSWPAMKTMILMMIIIILHRQQPLKCLPPHLSPNQHGSSDDGGPTQMRYTSHCFI
jgi:hypothetical protein